MINTADITAALFGRVGFIQTENPEYPELPTSLVASQSGLYYSGAIPQWLETERLWEAFPNYDKYNYPEYDLSNTYSAGDKVINDGHAWQAIQAVPTGQTPDTNDYWSPKFAVELEAKTKQAIVKVVNDVTRHKNVTTEIPTHLHSGILFKENTQGTYEENTKGRFVGEKILPLNGQGIRHKISSIGFRADTAGTYTLYLYHSSTNQALQSIEIVVATPDQYTWHDVDIDLKAVADTHGFGGAFYLGYFEADNPGKVWTSERYFPTPYKADLCRSLWVYMRSAFQSSKLNGTNIPDVGEYLDGDDDSDFYAFNLRLTAMADYTEIYTRDPQQWDQILQIGVAMELLGMVKNSTRLNRDTSLAQVVESIDFELYGQVAGVAAGGVNKKGLHSAYSDMLKQFTIDWTGFDTIFKRQNGLTQIR